MSIVKTVVCTALALMAFAGNSVLCRLALKDNAIDAASFTVLRLLSGVGMLFVLVLWQKLRCNSESAVVVRRDWKAALMLFLYALTFSYAYISLDTGTGALILFGSVQITMILVSVFSGSKFYASEWIGLVTACVGFVVLMLPGATAPSLLGFVLMCVAGIAWAVYTLSGRKSANALRDTAQNFLYTTPLVGLLAAVVFAQAEITPNGMWLALLSGAITSGLGYAIWYVALGGLTNLQAAVVQLLVPVIAAVGGILFSGEVLKLSLVISACLVLGGIVIVFLGRYRHQNG